VALKRLIKDGLAPALDGLGVAALRRPGCHQADTAMTVLVVG
jgi:hypothetical protein